MAAYFSAAFFLLRAEPGWKIQSTDLANLLLDSKHIKSVGVIRAITTVAGRVPRIYRVISENAREDTTHEQMARHHLHEMAPSIRTMRNTVTAGGA